MVNIIRGGPATPCPLICLFLIKQGLDKTCEITFSGNYIEVGTLEAEKKATTLVQSDFDRVFFDNIIGVADTSNIRGTDADSKGNDCAHSVSQIEGAYDLTESRKEKRATENRKPCLEFCGSTWYLSYPDLDGSGGRLLKIPYMESACSCTAIAGAEKKIMGLYHIACMFAKI